ncbi:hypothetical protein D3C86_2006970 [compost metagenome]
MAGALLVAHENVLDVFLLENLVIDRKHGTAGVTEDVLDAVILQRLQNDLRTCHAIAVFRIVLIRHCLFPSRFGFGYRGARGPV